MVAGPKQHAGIEEQWPSNCNPTGLRRSAVMLYCGPMWPFKKKEEEKPKRNRAVRRVIIGFIIGGAVSSIVGNALLKEKRREHLGEDAGE